MDVCHVIIEELELDMVVTCEFVETHRVTHLSATPTTINTAFRQRQRQQ